MNGNASQTQRLDTAIHQPERQRRFLAAFSACGSVVRASRWAKTHRQTHYFWMQHDPSYPARFRQAEMQAARTLEDEAVRRAHEGLRKPVWYKGKIVGYETEYSDTLLLAVLKANNPDKFRDRLEQTNVLEMDPDKMSPELLDKIADHLLKKALGENAPIAEINRRLAAGEDVTFEEAKAIEAPGEPLTIDAVCQAVNEPTRTTLEPEESQKPDSARHSRDGPVASTSGSMVGWHRNPLGTGD